MGVAQKTMFSISDHQANIFGISGAPMEQQNQRKRLYLIYFITFLLKYDPKILLYEYILHPPHMSISSANTQACIANEGQGKYRYVRGRESRSKYVRIDYEANH